MAEDEEFEDFADLAEEIEREPWEAQPNETIKSFEAFAIYRDMGANRSLLKTGQKLNKPLRHMENWSTKFRWVDRALAWDAYQDKILRDQHIANIKEMNERHIRLAQLVQSKALAKLQSMDEGTSSRMQPREVAQFLDLAIKVERIARGAPTEVVETRKDEESGPGRISRAILDSDTSMQKALDLLDEVANHEAASKREKIAPKATNPSDL